MFKRSPVVNLLTVLIPEKFQSFEILSIDHVYDKITTRVILPCRPPSKSDEIYAKLLADALPCLTKCCIRCCIVDDFNMQEVD